MTNTSLSQGIVYAIQTYIDTYDHTIQNQIEKARTEDEIVYERAFSSMVHMVQALLIQNFVSVYAKDKEYIEKQLSDRGSQFVDNPDYLEMHLLLKSKDITHLVEYVAYLTFIQYHTFKDENVGDWLYRYARDEVRCSEEDVEYIQKRIAPLRGLVLTNSPSLADLDISYMEKTLFELSLQDFQPSGQYLFQRVRNMVVRLGKYHPHVLKSFESEADLIYSMSSDPLVRVMYQATIVDDRL